MPGFFCVHSGKKDSAVISPVAFDDADDSPGRSNVDAALGVTVWHSVQVLFFVYLLVQLDCTAGTDLKVELLNFIWTVPV